MRSTGARDLIWVFSQRSRWQLAISVALSAALACVEIVAFSAVVPLAQILSGVSIADSPILSRTAEVFGTTNETELVAYISITMLALFLFKGVCGLWVRWWILGFIYAEEARLSEELITYYATENYEFHLANRSSDLLRNLNESVSHIFVFGVVGFVGLLSEATFVICVGLVLIAVAPLPMGVFLGYVGVATWIILRIIRPRARACGAEMMRSSADIYRLGADVISGYREVYLRDAAYQMVANYMGARRKSTEAHRRAGFLAEAPRYLLEMVFVTGLALFAGVLFASAGAEKAFPMLAFVVVIGFRLVPTLSRMLSFASLMRIGLPSLETVRPHLEVARSRRMNLPAHSTAEPLSLKHAVVVADVSYRYPEAHYPAIENISIQMRAGSTTALVGRSGSGKSTLADVLSGLLAPMSGAILVDGTDVQSSRRRWNAGLGVVSQSTYILDASIRENVAFGVPPDDIDDDQVRSSLAKAGFADFVDAQPMGINSQIGEGGAALSGGQRQRLGLARAFYTNPQFLILDEATSALDSKTESLVTEALNELRGNVTILIIAHRLSTVQQCDQVAYMDGGQILHTGSFSAVYHACADFAEMVSLGNVGGDALTP